MASLHFCADCNNLLYPKADNATRTLTFACRMCDYVEVDDKRPPIYRNDLLTVTREQAGVTTDLANDMTLSHTNALRCPKCGHNESVYYQDQSKRKETRMILFFVCAKCSHSFLDPNLKVSGRGEDVDMGD